MTFDVVFGYEWDENCLECDHSTGTCLQCMPSDSDGYTYVVGEEGYCVEEQCPNHCKTCNYNIDTDALECLECDWGYTVDMTSYPFDCVKTECSCGEFYDSTDRICKNCPDTCAECTADSCSKCHDGYHLLEVNVGEYECVEECPEGQTYNQLTNMCGPCKENC